MDEESQAQPSVERVDMSDGRYILYFSWPGEPPAVERSGESEAHDDE